MSRPAIRDSDGRLWKWSQSRGYVSDDDFVWDADRERWMLPEIAIHVVPRATPSKVSKRKLYRAANGKCGICGGHFGSFRDMTIDHVVPRSKGGANYGNIVPAHEQCNVKKGNRLPTNEERAFLNAVNARLS